ncbi:vWA domain-containing protein [Chryseomicrobium sp. FSL W7-1435]|uniref:vWA domain-containing protein n=1 Tax=Chryseomicrobium sp. FSL W7-1435 TaxID=2921704 RepID=UPI003159A661
MKTEILFLVDRSGSMQGLEKDTIGGYNSLLQKQREVEGEVILSTLLFDNEIEWLHDRMKLEEISPITQADYYVRGSTALLDAIGIGIQKLINVQKQQKAKVLVVITTDGMENASREYNAKQIRKMITAQKELGWEFLFLGANIDAITTAEHFGIHRDFAVNYHADAKGTELNFASVNEAVSAVRSGKKMSREWKAQVEQDFKTRK